MAGVRPLGPLVHGPSAATVDWAWPGAAPTVTEAPEQQHQHLVCPCGNEAKEKTIPRESGPAVTALPNTEEKPQSIQFFNLGCSWPSSLQAAVPVK